MLVAGVPLRVAASAKLGAVASPQSRKRQEHSRGRVHAESGSSLPLGRFMCVGGGGAPWVSPSASSSACGGELANSLGGRLQVPCEVVRLLRVVALCS